MRAAPKFNPPIYLVAGIITFCLGILVGIFNGIDKLTGEPAKLLGYVLVWISITAAVAMVSAFTLQSMKALATATDTPTQNTEILIYICQIAPAIPGFFTVVACVRVGGAIVAGTAELPTFWKVLCDAMGVVT